MCCPEIGAGLKRARHAYPHDIHRQGASVDRIQISNDIDSGVAGQKIVNDGTSLGPIVGTVG